MSIRTDIEALTHYAGTGRWQPGQRMIDRSKVLDIADQHDKEHATLQSELAQVKTEDPATEHLMMLINKRAELRAMADQLRGERATLHSELVQLRVSYAEIEAERNRLAAENRRLTANQERVEEFARDLERKGTECRKRSQDAKNTAWFSKDLQTETVNRLTAKASTYEAEARSLRQILEGK